MNDRKKNLEQEATYKFSNRELSIPLYLNQKIVIDLITILDNGFAEFQMVTTRCENSNENKSAISGEFNGKFIDFLTFGVNATKDWIKKVGKGQEVQEKRTFTTASLFSKLRKLLITNELLINLDKNKNDFNELKPEMFVEFSGVIKKNPLTEVIEKIIQIGELTNTFSAQKIDQKMMKMFKEIKTFFSQNESVDLITQLNGLIKYQAVVPVQLAYLQQESPVTLIDGQFVEIGRAHV